MTTSARIAWAALAALAALLAWTPSPAGAQSWAFLEVYREADLDFGQAIQGSGPVERFRTSPDVAKFKITGSLPAAGTGQKVVTLTLHHADLDGPAGGSVPFTLKAAYNSAADNAATATTFSSATVDIPLQILEGYQGGIGIWAAYLYVYGDVSVGFVPVGHYTSDVTVVATKRLPTGGTGTLGCEAAWDPTTWYVGDDWVEYQGHAWRALWWNAGNPPGSGGPTDPWEDMGACGAPQEGPACAAFAWNETRVYQGGDWATYGGKAWRALFYSRGNVPGAAGASGPWEEMGPCDGTPWNGTGCATLPWVVTRVYHEGDRATHNGYLWEAQYYTRGAAPGTSNAWEQVQSCGLSQLSPFRLEGPYYSPVAVGICLGGPRAPWG